MAQIKNPFKWYTIMFQFKGGMKQPISVQALDESSAKKEAIKRMEQAYGKELASQHTIKD